MNICMVVSYDGSRFAGWQKNGNTGGKRAIQTVFEEILSDYFLQEVHVQAAGRTDAGVNAFGQVLNFHLSGRTAKVAGWKEKWAAGRGEELCRPLNLYMRQKLKGEEVGAVAIRLVKPVHPRFHSRFDAVGKTYDYYFDERERPNVFSRAYAFPAGQTLDLSAMRQAAEYLVGTHDFIMFSSVRANGEGTFSGQSIKKPDGRRDTVRTIAGIDIGRVDGLYPPCGLVRFSVTGDGFLYHMVRILAGTLFEVGCKTRAPENVKKLLESGVRADAGVLLPGNALFLRRVYYHEKVLLTKLQEGV
ncbi:MAG: tRNA pseudouridine synthase A [Lachnospiraceae bacterium]|nr:tRNA pseudouridine synthase A [Lachnospiraceae bacterium]